MHNFRILVIACSLVGFASPAAPAQDARVPGAADNDTARQDILARGLEFTPHEFVGVAGAGETEHVVLFLQAGMDPESSDTHGQSALIAAAYEGMADVVVLLLDAGSNPNAADSYGATALLYAASEGYGDIVGALLQRGAKPNVSDLAFGRTPLMVAALEGHAEIAADLIAAGALINAQSVVDTSTPLMLAASNGRDEVVSVLLKNRCDRKKKDKLGRTAEDLARLQGFTSLAQRIKAGK